MKDRIRQIMESEQLTPSAFADKLQLGRAIISHILNGRNNPSLDVVTRILSKMNYINPDWLLTGNGEMYKTEKANSTQITNQTAINSNLRNQPDLFAQNSISTSNDMQVPEYRKENIVEQITREPETIIEQQVIYQKAPERKISKIIIYYTDNTFETFNADNSPL